MKRRTDKEGSDNAGRWLITYADIMNNLLILFIMLYAMSMIDLEKFERLKEELQSSLNQTEIVEQIPTESEQEQIIMDEIEGKDEFDAIYTVLKKEVSNRGYEDSIMIERGPNYIRLRFGDSVLFYPDSPEFKPESIGILQDIGTILKSVDNLIRNIEIGGHTATIGVPTTSTFAWELSAERAIAVLKFMVGKCQLPESKMSIAGYSKFQPVGDNNTEAGRKMNRRVEVKIIRHPKTAVSENVIE
ncbi:MAG: OmpA/MotB family protein [Bacillota bacterium]|jgi:chemotaxis protein MotB